MQKLAVFYIAIGLYIKAGKIISEYLMVVLKPIRFDQFTEGLPIVRLAIERIIVVSIFFW